MKNISTSCIAVSLLLAIGLGCGRFARIGGENLFEGDNAAKAAEKIKAKIGSENVKVIRAEIRKEEMTLTIQSPANPKNIDKYTYEKGTVSGPEPVQVISIGDLEMTGDKYQTTDLSEIGFTAIPETVRQAIALSKLENADVGLITMDNQSPEMGTPRIKEERERQVNEHQREMTRKQRECTKDISRLSECMAEVRRMQQRISDLRFNRGGGRDLVLTWRLFVEAPRGRKDFWADKKGRINENPF